MEIIGIGTEIVECVRIGRMIEKHGESFLASVFTAEEIRYCQRGKNATARFASLWAGKEAVLRALGVQSIKGLGWKDLRVIHRPGKAPSVELVGPLKEVSKRRRVSAIHLALAHCRTHATAHAMALKR